MAWIGGLMHIPAEVVAQGASPSWLGYIGVENVDATLARLTTLGGALTRPAENIPGVGRFAVVSDPQGAVVVLFTAAAKPPETPAIPARTEGHVGWHELHARDQAAVFPFYAELFGWSKGQTLEMGPMGTYQLFTTGGEAVGGMFTDATASAKPFWLYYISTGNIARAAERVKVAGGTVVMEPHEVPGGAWVVQCRDPQGVLFAMVGTGPAS